MRGSIGSALVAGGIVASLAALAIAPERGGSAAFTYPYCGVTSAGVHVISCEATVTVAWAGRSHRFRDGLCSLGRGLFEVVTPTVGTSPTRLSSFKLDLGQLGSARSHPRDGTYSPANAGKLGFGFSLVVLANGESFVSAIDKATLTVSGNLHRGTFRGQAVGAKAARFPFRGSFTCP